MLNIEEEFDKYSDEHGRFELIVFPLHPRPDMCAFMLLNELLSPTPGEPMISGASHGRIHLNVACDNLARIITTDDIIMLVRCGVHYDDQTRTLALFV